MPKSNIPIDTVRICTCTYHCSLLSFTYYQTECLFFFYAFLVVVSLNCKLLDCSYILRMTYFITLTPSLVCFIYTGTLISPVFFVVRQLV